MFKQYMPIWDPGFGLFSIPKSKFLNIYLLDGEKKNKLIEIRVTDESFFPPCSQRLLFQLTLIGSLAN